MGLTQYVARQFGKPKGVGGKLAALLMNRMNGVQYRGVMSQMQIEPGNKVLDVGFGNGYLLKKLYKQEKGAEYHGVDISQDMILQAEKRCRKAIEKGKMELLYGEAEELPYGDGYFHWVSTVNTVYFWDSLDAGLREIARVLRPGGTFVNAVYEKEWMESFRYTQYGFRKYSAEELRQAAGRSGLIVHREMVLKENTAWLYVLQKSAEK